MATATTSLLNFPRKDPQAKIAYALDWSEYLDSTETITNATIVVTGADKLGESIAPDGKSVEVIVGGGTVDTIATVHFHITTSELIEDERTVNLEIVQR